MTTHVEFIEDANGDLIDVWYYCSAPCYRDDTGKGAYGHTYPCPDYGDGDMYCHHCGQWLHCGATSDDECNGIRERSVAGTDDEPPYCPTHGAYDPTSSYDAPLVSVRTAGDDGARFAREDGR